MEDESHGSMPNGPKKASPESPSVKVNNKEQDRFLPIANVGRIMKKVIPSNGKISKEAKETVQECVSEFISFVTGEASDKCQREKRKTINGDDIIWAITTLGFQEYVAPLKLYLSKYREIEGEKLSVPKQQRPSSSSEHQQKQPSLPLLPPQQSDQHDHQNIANYNGNVYSSTNLLMSHTHHHPSFMASDNHHHHHQPFSLPFSSNSIQKQLQQQDQIDSVGHW